MDILLGIAITLVAILLYDKFKTRKPKTNVIDLEERKKEKEIEDHYNAMLNYTPEQAYKRGTR